MKPYYQDEWVKQYHSDALTILRGIEGDSIDLLCTDPPYGISFMGKAWDKALPDINIWKECLRVLKPGSFAFVMSIPRSDCLSRMIISLEDAGFRVDFTPIYWTYASGFPKAQNIGKAVDKRNGRNQDNGDVRQYLRDAIKSSGKTQKEVSDGLETFMLGHYIGDSQPTLPTVKHWRKLKGILNLDNRFDELIEREEAEREVTGQHKSGIGKAFDNGQWRSESQDVDDTLPSTSQAKALDGSYGGFQPKPAVEVIIVAMKPLSEKTFVDQALKNQKGITWLDDCRIPYESEGDKQEGICERQSKRISPFTPLNTEKDNFDRRNRQHLTGRFPANLLVSDDVLNDGRERLPRWGKAKNVGQDMETVYEGGFKKRLNSGDAFIGDAGSFSRYFDLDKWYSERLQSLPKGLQKILPFLIVPKASKSEKNKGCEDIETKFRQTLSGNSTPRNERDGKTRHGTFMRNNHPTVKPLKLMSYLITLGSREGDTVLDPFMGSGTTLLASKLLNRKCIGIEIEEKYCEIAAKRCSQGVFDLR